MTNISMYVNFGMSKLKPAFLFFCFPLSSGYF